MIDKFSFYIILTIVIVEWIWLSYILYNHDYSGIGGKTLQLLFTTFLLLVTTGSHKIAEIITLYVNSRDQTE